MAKFYLTGSSVLIKVISPTWKIFHPLNLVCSKGSLSISNTYMNAMKEGKYNWLRKSDLMMSGMILQLNNMCIILLSCDFPVNRNTSF